MFAGTANTKARPPAAAGNTYLCRARRRACPLERRKMTFKRSHIDPGNHPFYQKAAEVFLNSQGIPGANPFIDQKRLAINLIRTSFMIPQYMKHGLLCQEE